MSAAHIIDLIDPATAADIASKVNALRKDWLPRDNYALFSLGAAAYLDSPTDETINRFGLAHEQAPNAYANNVAILNTTLRQEFSPLYELLTDALQSHMQAPVRYASGKALPGFHIFNHHTNYQNPTAHVAHYDRQYEQLDWDQDVEVGTVQTISFTLPVKLPAAGAGLLLWDVNLADILSMDREAAIAKVKSANVHRQAYEVGKLVCHPGHQLHRIAPWKSSATDQRMTLQGHAILLDHTWQVYW